MNQVFHTIQVLFRFPPVGEEGTSPADNPKINYVSIPIGKMKCFLIFSNIANKLNLFIDNLFKLLALIL